MQLYVLKSDAFARPRESQCFNHLQRTIPLEVALLKYTPGQSGSVDTRIKDTQNVILEFHITML